MHLPVVTELCNGHFPLLPPGKKKSVASLKLALHFIFITYSMLAQEFRKITVKIQHLPRVRITGSELSGCVKFYYIFLQAVV